MNRTRAPVLVEDNPLFRTLFGSIEHQSDEDVLVTDFSYIRAGSLLQANGGFLLLHLCDLLADELVWEKLRRFLRSGRLQIECFGCQGPARRRRWLICSWLRFFEKSKWAGFVWLLQLPQLVCSAGR